MVALPDGDACAQHVTGASGRFTPAIEQLLRRDHVERIGRTRRPWRGQIQFVPDPRASIFRPISLCSIICSDSVTNAVRISTSVFAIGFWGPLLQKL
jgi:hypothetical protein